ncbi:MAG: ACP S-malonyltransferase [Oscillospiraceae bacterium]|nr:ACP S-malonyltransferase [Oscillospiraceae bacterium]
MNLTKTALLFSGQGSQYAEMGKELFAALLQSRPDFFTSANEILGFNLQQKINDGDFQSTEVVQPAVFAVSIAALEAARQSGIEFHGVAGHSLGEYAALYACGVITLESGFRLLKIRGEVMSRATIGGMAAVLGLDSAVIEATLAEIADVEPVNYNSPLQTVIAGSDEGLAKAEIALKSKGAKRIARLSVAAAFHSKFMRDAAAEYEPLIQHIDFKPATVPFYSNVTGEILADFSEMPSYLARHICSPVRFCEQLYAMERDGFGSFVELGPGKVLAGLVRKTLPGAEVSNL